MTDRELSDFPVLMYHSVDSSGSVLSVHPTRFAEQVGCLAEMGFRGLSLWEAVRYYREHARWPERAVAITFDDGYENVHHHAMPVLAEHGFTATVYLVTRHMGGRNDWEEPPAGLGIRSMLSWTQTGDLAEAGWEIGAHTRTHPDLTRIPEDVVQLEIIGSRTDVENVLGEGPKTFAYPFGRLTTVAAKIVSCEFEAACTTELRCAAGGDVLHALPRIEMFYIQDLDRLRRLVTGRLGGYLAFRRFGRSVRERILD